MEEAKLRIQQMAEESGFKVDKKQIPPTTEINTEELNTDHLGEERNVVYIDKNELKDNPQNILNIENSVVYISSSSRAASPTPSHKEDQGPTLPLRLPPLPPLGTQSLKSQDNHADNMHVIGSQGSALAPTRVSVSDSRVHFPHRGNSNYVLVEEDPTLGRKIVTVREICWLEIGHTFSVTPGTYSVSLRLRVNPGDFRWPHKDTDPTIFSLSYPSSSGQESRSVSVYKDWWNALTRTASSPPLPHIEGLSVHMEDGGWGMVTMAPVTVTEGGLVFRMRDVECPHWKSGLSFDFLQLTRH